MVLRKILAGASALVLGACSVVGVRSGTEEPSFETLDRFGDVEIRRYAPRMAAETLVAADETASRSEGFSRLARYIFGGNAGAQSIAMTAPVAQQASQIAMTAPVMATSERGAAPEKSFTATFVEGETIVAFGMPQDIVPESLPFPVDPRVTIVTRPETLYAVLRFGGYRSDATIKRKEKILRERLISDGIEAAGALVYAGYDAPGTPPWMTRHEVMIPIAL